MRFLVTGATGFIGRERVKHLISQGHEVIAVGNQHKEAVAPITEHLDIADKDSIKYVVSRFKPDRIEHFASQATVGVSRDDPWTTYKTNVLGAVSVCQTALQAGLPLTVFTTDKYYGDREVAAEDDRPVVCAGTYETSKLCQDLIAQSYRRQGADITIARSCNVFGAFDSNRRIVPNVIRSLQEGRRPVIFTNVLGTRQYIYMKDLMRALDAIRVAAVESPDVEKTYNIGTDIKMTQEETVSAIIQIWNDYTGTYIQPEYKAGPDLHEIPSQYLVWNKIRETGWSPLYDFEESIIDIFKIQSIKENSRVVKIPQ
jgi:nucleoside-diphosphate-sugar epimerase